MSRKTSVAELKKLLSDIPYSHLELGAINDHAAYVMNFKGVHAMHSHARDEMYFVLEGKITIRFKNAPAETLRKGESMTVPAYMTHSSESTLGALVLMIKPKDMFPKPQDLE
ncbi:MAG: cupin domain-containing protein [Holophaga sp.]|nr:cupin domain-containing protein [Holophaga sp.]